ncbi:acyl-CoA transferase [Bordetella ansorpii]|uniref:Acyl-CoA transferase n=1 Tax=Bordetella ansorpii TaxID=288768 RepID=A0A157S4S6_9BORD|nr:CaiB/BaiF CoA-transferase family protein [Bordetella ansorpii]SAI65417.1 acyl-CoA transferase [Bordetella ansorpii]
MQPLLSNIKVLDLSRVLAGPWASQILADLGADVIKVERPGRGDDTRSWGPPFLKDEDGEDTADGAYFVATNRGKRSITLDLQTAEGQELVRTLCRDADVVLENYKVGTLARLGLDYESLSEVNPRLVYCSVTGFGQTGPRAAEPAYDFLIQAMGGLMSVTGERDDKPGGGPQKVGVPIVDLSTGVYAALGIVAALLRRTQTGRGEYVDVAMLDVQVGLLANQAMNFLLGNRVPRRTGTAHPNIQPQRTFACADGDIIIVVGNDAQFVTLCDVIGRPELARDERFATNGRRVRNQAELDPILDEILASQPRAHWLAKLKDAGVPAGSINSVAEVFEDEQVVHRGMLRHLPHPAAGLVPQVMTPLRFGGADLRVDRAPPLLGEHTHEVLAELGLSDARIEDYRARKII